MRGLQAWRISFVHTLPLCATPVTFTCSTVAPDQVTSTKFQCPRLSTVITGHWLLILGALTLTRTKKHALAKLFAAQSQSMQRAPKRPAPEYAPATKVPNGLKERERKPTKPRSARGWYMYMKCDEFSLSHPHLNAKQIEQASNRAGYTYC